MRETTLIEPAQPGAFIDLLRDHAWTQASATAKKDINKS
jgi:hypothetical protein